MPDFAPGEEDDSPLVTSDVFPPNYEELREEAAAFVEAAALERDPFVRAEHRLSDEEREYFLSRWIAWNPSWNGAHVADILAEMENADTHCDDKDRMCRDMGQVSQFDGIAIDILATLGQSVTAATVTALSARLAGDGDGT